MNTHIIIPIRDIEDINPGDYHKRPSILIAKIISLGKQISLDEKDIEEKAQKIYPALDFRYRNFPKKEAYKQSLKDLL